MQRKNAVKRFGTLIAILFVALLATMMVPSVSAQRWDKKTIITFSGPVEIPGVHLKGWGVLPAGTYVFKILDSQSDRHIVQIFSQDEKTVYATILAIPNYRLKTTDKTVITFSERPVGQPEALRAWFYPGHQWGEEFVYPKDKAAELAKATKVPDLYTPAELPHEVEEPAKLADEPVIAVMRRAPIQAIQPTGEEAPLAQVITPPPAESEVAMATPARRAESEPVLPDTASPLALMALFGFLAMGGAMATRAVRTVIR